MICAESGYNLVRPSILNEYAVLLKRIKQYLGELA